jgi:myo-inositol-1(or 4)-monophosphatase
LKDFPGQLDLGFAAGAADVALEAGELLRGYFERGVTTEYKGDVDLVTEADRASEKLIVSRLSQQFPDHGIFGLPLVCRPARWHDEFLPRLSVL